MREHPDAYDALDPYDDTPEGDWRPPRHARDPVDDVRLSHEYRVLRRNFLYQHQCHRNEDGTYGTPCWLCHKSIDYRTHYRSAFAPQVDHVIPIRLAPERALDTTNWRPAHAHCNKARARRYADEKCEIGIPSESW
jgi:5-methylcytosine-specific restriction endonuclease McrA